ncbi:MAG: SpoIIE family protein phosphatase [Cyclobacteriaceae bacterium]|nr:SpoIIE family protein phosphatase [Cyclobacteriaceae bacterium]MCH8515455.1 SpoIIE family protein phosphatase [Cyclobacteriaceae bacterium]
MQLLKSLILGFLINLLLILGLFASTPIQLKQGMTSKTIGEHVYIYQDPTYALELKDIMGMKDEFERSNTPNISLGYTQSVLWAYFDVENLADGYNSWILKLSYNLLNSVTFYKTKDGEVLETIHSGNSIPFRERSFEHTDFVFPLDQPDEGSYRYYFRVESESSKQLPLTIYSTNSFYKERNTADILYGMFFGIMVVMIIYNLFIFFSLRDVNYLIYVLAISGSTVFFASFQGYAFQYIWPEFPRFAFSIIPISVGVWAVFSALFARVFLNTDQYAPIFSKILMVIMAIGSVGILLGAMGNYPTAIKFSAGAAALNSVVIIAAGLTVWLKGQKTARYFTVAWMLLLMGTLLLTLQIFGILPATFITKHAVEIGAVLEVTLLSLALSDKFSIMKKEKEQAQAKAIKLQKEANEVLEMKVKERTFELNMQKEKIESSVRYAKRIQDVMLTGRERIKQVFDDSFILFKPRDIVSGDFYWIGERNNKVIIAAVDCTGHGVPGAFMSLLGYNLLNEIVINRGLTDPGKILSKMDKGIRNMLNQDSNNNKDGMDAAIMVWDQAEQQLQFAGAKNPLVIFKGDEELIIKGAKFPIGGSQKMTNKHFETHTLPIDEAMDVYLFSDGFQDQFGGELNRKYMTRRFRSFLKSIHRLPSEEQEELLEQEFLNWKGNEQQLDDILIMGLRISNNKLDLYESSENVNTNTLSI